MIHPLLFRAAREAAALKMALKTLGEQSGSSEGRQLQKFQLLSEVNPVLQLAALLSGWSWKCATSSEKELIVGSKIVFPDSVLIWSDSSEVTIVDLYALPDPIGRLQSVRAAARGPVLVVFHLQHSGPEDVVSAATANMFDTYIIQFETITSDTVASDFGNLSSLIGSLFEEEVRAGQRFSKRLNSLIGAPLVVNLHVSDHVSPASTALLKMAGQKNTTIHIYSHGAWPLPEPFRINCSVVRNATINRYNWLDDADDPNCKVSPPQRFSNDFRSRARRRLLKAAQLLSQVGASRKNIGVFVTSGQDLLAADIDVIDMRRDILALVNLCQQGGYNLDIRLRETSDDLLYLKQLVVAEFGTRGARVNIHRVTDISMDRFLSRVALVLELGHPTSAVLEAFQMGVPVYRWAEAGSEKDSGGTTSFDAGLLETMSPAAFLASESMKCGLMSRETLRNTAQRQSVWLRSNIFMK